MLRILWSVAAITSVLALGQTLAAGTHRRDVMGTGLGMTAAEIVKDAKLPCWVNKTEGVSCEDPTDGSSYRVLFSGGAPSRALSVKRTFCSSAPRPRLLGLC